jgi:hypothetical protein
MKIKDKIRKGLDAQFRVDIVKALTDKFGELGFKTEFNIFSMTLVTTWDATVSKRLCVDILAFAKAYETAYLDAMQYVGSFK